MSITQKLNLPSQFGDEAKEYRELFEKGSNRTTTGTTPFISSTSATTYNTTTGDAGIYSQLQTVLADYNIDEDWVTTIVEFDSENNLNQYNRDVTAVDGDGNITEIEYERPSDLSLFLKRNYSNPDGNGFYQTAVELFYEGDGTTVYKTITYTFTYLTNGYIDTASRVVS